MHSQSNKTRKPRKPCEGAYKCAFGSFPVNLEAAQDNVLCTGQELFNLRAIILHQGSLAASDSDRKGSKYNVQVEWETGEITCWTALWYC